MYTTPPPAPRPAPRWNRLIGLAVSLAFAGLVGQCALLVFKTTFSVILGWLPALIAAIAGGRGYLRLIRFVGGRRRSAALAIMAATLLAAPVLWPVACDIHESWVDVPNRRCDCHGLVWDYYPRGTTDGAEIEYCIGIER